MSSYFDKDFFKFLGGFVAILGASFLIFWATSGLRASEGQSSGQQTGPALPDQYQTGYTGK